MKQKILNVLWFFGFYPNVLIRNLKGLRFYYKDLKELKRQKKDDNSFYFGKAYPILNERYSDAGVISGHYFHQDLFVARKIFENKPQKHVDIGSRTDGFIAHVASFMPIELLDIRALTSKVKNITFRQADLMQLPKEMINYCDSISSLHAIEHFGLGRYGDPIDYNGHIKAIKNIQKILKKDGTFYFSVPMGPQRIEFNAHRIFSLKYLIDLLQEDFEILEFSYVDDNGDFQENVELEEQAILTNYGCNHGCGIFELRKIG